MADVRKSIRLKPDTDQDLRRALLDYEKEQGRRVSFQNLVEGLIEEWLAERRKPETLYRQFNRNQGDK